MKMLLLGILVIISLQSCDGINLPGTSASIFDWDGYYELVKEVVSKGQFAGDRGESVRFFDDRREVMLGELMTKLDEVSDKLDVMEDRMLNKLDGLESILRVVADDIHRKRLMHEVVISMKIVREHYDELGSYAGKKEVPKRIIMRSLEDNVSDGRKGLTEQLRRIHRTIVPNRHTGSIEETLLDVWRNTLNQRDPERCNEMTPQYLMYSLYTAIVSTEMIGFVTTSYSAKLLEKETDNDETDEEIEMVKDDSTERLEGFINSFLPGIRSVNRDFRTCDPAAGNHVRDETYTEMWGLTQGIVMQEYGMKWEKSCNDVCGSFSGSKPDMTRCWTSFNRSVAFERYKPSDYYACSTPRKCYGFIHDCQDLFQAQYCKLADSTRRYEFIKDKTNSPSVEYSPWTPCDNGYNTEFSDYGGDMFSSCADCMCLCDDDDPRSYSVHTISLMESSSNTKEDNIVIGVRFRVEDRVLHIQVREAPALSEYRVNMSLAAWVDLPKIGQQLKPFDKNPVQKLGSKNLEEGIDYHTFKIGHAFNLNEVLLKYNRVVTGVRFAKSERKEKEDVHIDLQVRSMAFDPKTGKLKQGSEQWEKTSQIHDSKLTIVKKLPYEAKSKTLLESGHNNYIQLEPSEWEEDAAQTVLPLFDAQTLEAKPIGPFGGLGLHYRAAYEHSGFIGITGYNLDYVGFMEIAKKGKSSE